MAPRSRSKFSAPVQRAPTQRAPTQRTPTQRAPVEEEFINIDDVTGGSEDEAEDTLAPVKARAAPAEPDDEVTYVAPIVKPPVKSHKALDIDLLFERGKGKPSVCKYCK